MSSMFVRSVLQEHAQSNRPAELDMWPAIYSQLLQAREAQARRSRIRLALTPPRYKVSWKPSILAGVLSLLMVMGALFILTFNPPASVSAAEILAQAGEVVDSTTITGIQSFHGIYTLSYRNAVDQAFTEIQSETWFQAPNSYLYRETTRAVDGRQSSWYNGTDGVTFYQYVSVNNQLQLRDLDSLPARDPSTDTFRIRLFNPTNLSSLLDAARRQTPSSLNPKSEPRPPYEYDVKLAGSESVLGRQAYILDLTFVPGSSLQLPDMQVPTHIKLWIDQQLYAVLRIESRDARDQVTQSGAYSTFQVNRAIDPSAFSFLESTDAQVVDMRSVTADQVSQAWQLAAQRAPFVVFVPKELPEGVTAGAPIYNAFQGTLSQVYLGTMDVVVRPSYDSTEGKVITGNPGPPKDYNPQVRSATMQWLVLTEGPPSAINESNFGQVRSVQLGELMGRIYDRPDGSKALVVDQAGTRIMLQVPASVVRSDSQIENQMIKFVESVRSIPEK